MKNIQKRTDSLPLKEVLAEKIADSMVSGKKRRKRLSFRLLRKRIEQMPKGEPKEIDPRHIC